MWILIDFGKCLHHVDGLCRGTAKSMRPQGPRGEAPGPPDECRTEEDTWLTGRGEHLRRTALRPLGGLANHSPEEKTTGKGKVLCPTTHHHSREAGTAEEAGW